MIRVLLALLRPLARIARALELCAAQLLRLADHAEGIAHSRPIADAPEEATGFAQGLSDSERTLAYQFELGLRQHLGHDPTPEQILHELEGLQHGPEDLTPEVRERLGL